MSAYVGPFSAVREIEITYGRRGRGRLSGRPVTTPGAAAAVAAPFFARGERTDCPATLYPSVVVISPRRVGT